MNFLKMFGQTAPTAPEIEWPTFDFSSLLGILTDGIGSVVMPALPFLIGAAAIVGAVTWIYKRGRGVVKLK